VLENNNADNLTITPGSTSFTFTTKITNNAGYSVTVVSHPSSTSLYQACVVNNGSGTVAGADVTNVLVSCSTSTWESLASLSNTPAFSDCTPAGRSELYTLNSGTFRVFSFPTQAEPQGVFSALTSTTGIVGSYLGHAWAGGSLYQVIGSTVYAYNIAGHTWTKPQDGTLIYSHDLSQCTADDSGFVYSMSTTTHLLKFNTASSTVQYITAPIDLVTDEPRAAWDSKTERVYMGGYFIQKFYAFNPANGSFTELAPFPEATGMSDAFCSDRRGHVFTSHNTLPSIWMYTAETDTWSQIPGTPFDHNEAESCTVSADGWLYYGTSTGDFARFKIF
jgi:hypothetical protein